MQNKFTIIFLYQIRSENSYNYEDNYNNYRTDDR